MIIPVLSLLAILSVPLTGGRLSNVRDLRLLHVWAPVAAVVAQTAAISVLSGMHTLALVVHAASYAVAVWFLWINRSIPWLWLIGVGGFANLAAIAANGGVMPATADAVARSGLVMDAGFSNSAPSTGSSLWFLGDVFAIPAGWPLANVFSIGDVVLLVGLTLLLHRVSRAAVPTAEIVPA